MNPELRNFTGNSLPIAFIGGRKSFPFFLEVIILIKITMLIYQQFDYITLTLICQHLFSINPHVW